MGKEGQLIPYREDFTLRYDLLGRVTFYPSYISSLRKYLFNRQRGDFNVKPAKYNITLYILFLQKKSQN